MKATFENIGPIKKAELELGDLTIIAGQNNTGKTYLAYTLCGFLKGLENEHSRSLRLTDNGPFNKTIKEIAKQLEHTGKVEITLAECENVRKNALGKITKFFSLLLLDEVFSAPRGTFKNARFNIEVEHKNSSITNTIDPFRFRDELLIKSFLKGTKVVFEVKHSENIEISTTDLIYTLNILFAKMIRNDWPDTFILCAERFGISLFHKELDFTKNRLIEELQKLSDKKTSDKRRLSPYLLIDRQSARYAQPIKDNIDFTRELSIIARRKSQLIEDKMRSVSFMMDGHYKAYDHETRFISKKRKENRFNIPLHLASSSARGISNLYFYLKHEAKLGQFLIIDEPESHLSPTNQILMARLLVFCVNSGLKVLITTHSDYLIKEINNLIMLHGDFKGKDGFLKRNKKEYTENDHLDPAKVKAFICENGKLAPCGLDNKGIDMPVFDDAIEKINRASNELGFLKESDEQSND